MQDSCEALSAERQEIMVTSAFSRPARICLIHQLILDDETLTHDIRRICGMRVFLHDDAIAEAVITITRCDEG